MALALLAPDRFLVKCHLFRTLGSTNMHCSCIHSCKHRTEHVLAAGYGEFTTEGCIPDTVNGAKYVRDLYEKVNDTAGESYYCVLALPG